MSKARGWILLPDGTSDVVPDHLLGHEVISWPPMLDEISSNQSVRYLQPSDLYHRHEISVDQAYVFLRSDRDINAVPDSVIDDLLHGRPILPQYVTKIKEYEYRGHRIAAECASNGVASTGPNGPLARVANPKWSYALDGVWHSSEDMGYHDDTEILVQERLEQWADDVIEALDA